MVKVAMSGIDAISKAVAELSAQITKDKAARNAILHEAANLIIAKIESSTTKTCKCCGCLFVITPPYTRGNRAYCSCACSSRAYRERKLSQKSER